MNTLANKLSHITNEITFLSVPLELGDEGMHGYDTKIAQIACFLSACAICKYCLCCSSCTVKKKKYFHSSERRVISCSKVRIIRGKIELRVNDFVCTWPLKRMTDLLNIFLINILIETHWIRYESHCSYWDRLHNVWRCGHVQIHGDTHC